MWRRATKLGWGSPGCGHPGIKPGVARAPAEDMPVESGGQGCGIWTPSLPVCVDMLVHR